LSSENKTLVEDAEDAATATVTWKDALAGTHGWYAVVTNQFGGSTTTRVSYVSATGKSSSSDNDGSGQDNGSNGDNDGGGSNGQSGAGSDTGHSGGTTQHGSDSDGDSAAKGNATDSDSKSLATQKTNILQERLAKTGTNSLLIVAAIVLLALCGVGLRWFKAVNK
jgi:cobalamin biosynthesis Mg chelatase CobN